MFPLHIDVRLNNCFRRVLLLSVFSAWAATVSAQVSADRLFPDSTKGIVVIRNLKLLGDEWNKTQIGALMNDPIMEPFKKDFREQLAKRMQDRFGLTLDGIQQLPSGEVAAGMIAIPDKTPGYVVTLDVTDRLKETEDYLKRLTQKLVDAGVKRSVEKYKDQEITVFVFPESAPTKAAGDEKSDGGKADASKADSGKTESKKRDRRAFYLLKNNHLIVSDLLHLVELMADRLEGTPKNSLGDVEDYKTVMKRCFDDIPKDAEPLIRWYIEPLNYGESIRTLLSGPLAEKRRNKPSIFTILKEQGFDAVKGIGGVVGIKVEEKEVVYRVFVYAKKPYKLAMRMLVFPDNTNFTPPSWMPPDLARCSMFYVDPVAIFDNFGSLFDALVMQGETGVWSDIITGLKEDPNGPQIDIREEIVVHLGQRVLGMSKYQLPITPQSESIVFAVELKEGKEAVMAKSIRKLFDNDTEMLSEKYKSYTLWHRAPADDVIQPFSGPSGVPDLVATPPTGGAKPAVKADEPAPMFPDGAITVAKGCLFVGTNLDYLKAILDRLDADLPSVTGNAEYKEVNQIFASMGITDKPHFFQFFAKTDETIRPTYELIRQGKMMQSQAILGKAINALVASADDEKGGSGVRQQAFDGSKLPEFDLVRKYFGPSGIYGASQDDGYFFKGFLLEKKAEPEIGPARKVEDKPKEKPAKAEDKPKEEPAKPDAAPKAEKPKEEGSVTFKKKEIEQEVKAEIKSDGSTIVEVKETEKSE